MLFQATGVAVGGSAVLLTGEPRIGKSSVALALIDRGAVLIGDDGVKLTVTGDRIEATPPPHTAGLLEVRGVGLIDLPTTSAPVALLVHFGEEGERLPQTLPSTDLAGCKIPTLRLTAPDWTTALRIEQALSHFGMVDRTAPD
ncbi:HPr kinase/phosphorylase [Qipengyuania sp. DSG2-2]|uniref:HPr kinase/phosphorylase n=1 Tax=Qipengyuania sp. DGS2-2 TaxID=3349631 RepID=UPI0036D419EB